MTDEGGSDFVLPPVLSHSNTSDVTAQPLHILWHWFPLQLQVFNSVLSNHGPLGDKIGGRLSDLQQYMHYRLYLSCIFT